MESFVKAELAFDDTIMVYRQSLAGPQCMFILALAKTGILFQLSPTLRPEDAQFVPYKHICKINEFGSLAGSFQIWWKAHQMPGPSSITMRFDGTKFPLCALTRAAMQNWQRGGSIRAEELMKQFKLDEAATDLTAMD